MKTMALLETTLSGHLLVVAYLVIQETAKEDGKVHALLVLT